MIASVSGQWVSELQVASGNWFGGSFTHKIESIHIGLVDPGLQPVGDLRRRADDDGTVAADADVLGDGVLRPFRGAGRELRVARDRGSVIVSARSGQNRVIP